MKYCTFKYRIEYEDGNINKGWSPYQGVDLSNNSLSKFVSECFQLAKPVRNIVVYDIFKISDAMLWLAHVRNSVEFKYLVASKGFPSGSVDAATSESRFNNAP